MDALDIPMMTMGRGEGEKTHVVVVVAVENKQIRIAFGSLG